MGASVLAAGIACSDQNPNQDSDLEVKGEHSGKASSPIYGNNAVRDTNYLQNPDTFQADTAVGVELADGQLCSGTLITPTFVLTSAHCMPRTPRFITLGPEKARWKRRVAVDLSKSSQMSSGPPWDANKDIALLKLVDPVFEEAKSLRPVVWDWRDDEVWGNDEGPIIPTFGMAGWSNIVGPWSCPDPSDNPGTPDPDHAAFRYRAEGFLQHEFKKEDNTIRSFEQSGNRGTSGDSGGPLYLMSHKGREVIGVMSHADCEGDLEQDRLNRWTNVTNGPPADWIRSQLLDSRSEAWRLKHQKSEDRWQGEVDYLGPCILARDADCDHWVDENDYCPTDWDPEQLEQNPPKPCLRMPSRAVSNGVTKPTFTYPDTYDLETPISGACPVGASTADCPPGFCYWTSIHGPFWQSTDGETDFSSSPAKFGTGMAIRISGDGKQWVIRNKGHRAERPVGAPVESKFGPGGVAECTGYDEIANLPSIDSCNQKRYIRADMNGTIESGSVPLAAINGPPLAVPTGFLGNIAQRYSFIPPEGGGSQISPDYTRVESQELRWRSGVNLPPPFFRGGAQREGFAYGCGSTTFPVVTAKVRAWDERPDVLLLTAADAGKSRCFISGLEGAWQESRVNKSVPPFADIYRAKNGDLRLKVEPKANIPGAVDDRVAATASCFRLLP